MQEELAAHAHEGDGRALRGHRGGHAHPFADIVPLTTLQAGLVAGIAWIGGRSVDRKGAGEFLAASACTWAWRSASVRWRERSSGRRPRQSPRSSRRRSRSAGTMAIGAAASAYYIQGRLAGRRPQGFRRSKVDPGADSEKR